MAIEPVEFIAPLREIATEGVAGSAAGTPDFGTWLTQALGRVNGELAQADVGLQQLATGQVENLHQVMIALEEARLGMQLVTQVRNRLLEAYQEILRMQV
jgi:flagellar hook-basal body complex protein FliE